jgi:hypothetical protein
LTAPLGPLHGTLVENHCFYEFKKCFSTKN